MKEVISASELEEYIYCPVAWYMHRSGVTPKSTNIGRGILHHGEEQRKILKARRNLESAKKVYYAGVALLVLALIFLLVRLWTT
ncbi:hypothetical protein [Archaeoglobus neptunius]|uniref:hypothetical protein n=1 Tax=Archaeoglobus neptunius TaxID=2798580 RepID=UPI001928CC98|nr:hypothetical protein [Archaeoglobus neptunius]